MSSVVKSKKHLYNSTFMTALLTNLNSLCDLFTYFAQKSLKIDLKTSSKGSALKSY